MPTRSARIYSFVLLVGDFVTLLVAFTIAYILRVQFDARPLVAEIPALEFFRTFLLIVPFWLFAFASLGLYRPIIYTRRLSEVGRLLIGAFIGILIVLGYAFVTKQEVFPARLVAIYAFITSFVLLAITREALRIFRSLAFRYGRGISRVLLVGNSSATKDIAEQLSDTAHSGFEIIAIAGPKTILPKNFNGFHYSTVDRAIATIKASRITTIIQTDLYDSSERNQKILGAALTNHLNYNFIPGEAEFYSGKNTVDVFLGYPVISVHQTPLVGWGEVVKRIFDLIVGALATLLLSPILLILIILQKLFNPGPVFYVSKRLTRYSKPIGLYKFRTMSPKFGRKDAADEFREMGREDLANLYERDRKITNDPRVTSFGKFLRITSLDEVPQLFNVLIGDLSLVGPRPILPQELKLYKGRGALLHSVKSGVTGLWQVSGRSNLSFDKRVELELYYAQNWTFWLDIKILFKTIRVLFEKGAAK